MLNQQPQLSWCQLFQGLYFPRRDFWHAEKGHCPSWKWQSLMLGSDSISPSIKWAVSNGTRIRTREDKWLKKGVLVGPAKRSETQFASGLTAREEGCWNETVLQEHFDEQTEHDILTIPIKPRTESDHIVWTCT